MATHQSNQSFGGLGNGRRQRTLPFPRLLLPQHGQQESNSPRQLAPLSTRKRDAPEPVDTQSELLSALVPLTKLIADFRTTTSPSSADAAPSTLSPTKPKPKHKKRIRPKTERRREQCKNNQARYRDRQRGYVRELEENVRDLQEEIQQLTKERHTLCYGMQTRSNGWNVVVEYFRLFRYGLPMPMMCGPESSGVPSTSGLHDQEYFLRAVMTSDVAFGGHCGVDALIHQWQHYSSSFGNLHLQLNRLEQKPLNAMSASANLSLTITKATLRNVFPHLLDHTGNDDMDSPLCARLLGQRLACRCSLRFSWDDAAGRITRLDFMMDLLTPLLKVLGNLQDVSYVLEEALLTPDNLIGEMPSTVTR